MQRYEKFSIFPHFFRKIDFYSKTGRPSEAEQNGRQTLCLPDSYACDPEMMGQVMKYAFSHYPAKEYGLVLGGHSTGWLIEEEPNKSDPSITRISSS